VKRRMGIGAALLVAALAAGCRDAEPKGLVARAEFGVFFGGQVQKREEIPFQLDRTKQTQGFRIELFEPAGRDLSVAWEIEKPAPRRPGQRRPKSDRVTELAQARARSGEALFEQLLLFEPGDPLGSWKIKVNVEAETVLERGFLVYDARQRALLLRKDGGL